MTHEGVSLEHLCSRMSHKFDQFTNRCGHRGFGKKHDFHGELNWWMRNPVKIPKSFPIKHYTTIFGWSTTNGVVLPPQVSNVILVAMSYVSGCVGGNHVFCCFWLLEDDRKPIDLKDFLTVTSGTGVWLWKFHQTCIFTWWIQALLHVPPLFTFVDEWSTFMVCIV